ncbi:hypothetical protein FHR99_002215 [Litorivivens lipolytica]|uniref:Copper resistance protein D n=1 Tax=Litorivivens lipolytica TaxID=1524264 RepID=A0A7W4W5R9_9GAMM|nr:hypothetical protein [Litorivivens lipolytica]MBB3047949.1 hypothetical protein [Litorivivens lipolytica]
MNEILWLQFAHIVAFVYWLGGDLGTFVASRYVVNRDIGVEARAIALKIMLACDQGPKMSMPLILPLGMHMSVSMGLVQIPTWALLVVWLLAAVWLGNVLVLYFNEGKAFTARLSQFDLYFRIAVVIALTVFAVMGLLDQAPIFADWVAWKILVFAALVCCGIAIRINLKPFVPAFVKLMSEGPSELVNNTMADSVARCRPWVWIIWLGLFVNAAFGVHLIG